MREPTSLPWKISKLVILINNNLMMIAIILVLIQCIYNISNFTTLKEQCEEKKQIGNSHPDIKSRLIAFSRKVWFDGSSDVYSIELIIAVQLIWLVIAVLQLIAGLIGIFQLKLKYFYILLQLIAIGLPISIFSFIYRSNFIWIGIIGQVGILLAIYFATKELKRENEL